MNQRKRIYTFGALAGYVFGALAGLVSAVLWFSNPCMAAGGLAVATFYQTRASGRALALDGQAARRERRASTSSSRRNRKQVFTVGRCHDCRKLGSPKRARSGDNVR